MTETTMKTCPMCAEEVQAAALICKHCSHQFAAPPPPAVALSEGELAVALRRRRVMAAVWVGLAVVVLVVVRFL